MLAANVSNMFKKKGEKPSAPEAFLPFKIEDYDPKHRLLQDKISVNLAKIIIKEYTEGKMPPRIARIVRNSAIYSICEEKIKNG